MSAQLAVSGGDPAVPEPLGKPWPIFGALEERLLNEVLASGQVVARRLRGRRRIQGWAVRGGLCPLSGRRARRRGHERHRGAGMCAQSGGYWRR